MKKILCILMSVCISFVPAFAEVTLDLSVDPQDVWVGDEFTLEISLTNDDSLEVKNIEVQGLDSFTQLGQSKSTQMFIDRGKSKTQIDLRLSLQADKEGTFILGPATIENGKKVITSGTKTIKVRASSLLGVNNVQKPLVSPQKTSTISQINDIQPPSNSFALSRYFLWFLGLLLFVWVFYSVLEKFLSREKKPREKQLLKPTVVVDRKKYFVEALKKLQKEIPKLERSQFFSNLNRLQREYLEYLWVEGARKKTIAELKKWWVSATTLAIWVLEKSYFSEFRQDGDSQENRMKCVEEFMLILQ